MPSSELWKLLNNKIGMGAADFYSSPLISVYRHGLCTYICGACIRPDFLTKLW